MGIKKKILFVVSQPVLTTVTERQVEVCSGPGGLYHKYHNEMRELIPAPTVYYPTTKPIDAIINKHKKRW